MKAVHVCVVCVGLCLSVFVCVTGSVSQKDSSSISKDKDVLILQKSNFQKALKRHKQLLVHFYEPLSRESVGSILEFSKAASELQRENSPIRLGSVDMSKEKELVRELNVTTVPSLRLYLSGDTSNPIYCPVLKSSVAILTWLRRREGPSADIITDLSQLESYTKTHETVVLGLFKDIEQGMVNVFYSAAVDLPDLPFGVTGSSDVFNKYDITSDTVLLFRMSKLEEKFEMSSDTMKEDLMHFIRVNEMALVTEYNGMTASQILNSVLLNHLILFINKTEESFPETYRAFEIAAKHFRGQVLFVLIDVSEIRNGRILEYFRIHAVEAPTVRMVNLTHNVQYQLPSDLINTHTLQEFCQSYLQGTAKPKLQSEPVPADWDKQPVKELVGTTFERVVFNDNNNVLVLFYAPWNTESQMLFPLWEELAETFGNHDNTVVAKIDITANDVNVHLPERYPSIQLFPAVYAERMVPYSGKRTLDALVEFVNMHIEKAIKDKAKEEEERKKFLEAQKAFAKEEL
ncbi:protein disulfide-isomerase [Chanos chanos]|uniref:protein disulfide-isomerase n=1 Tax=Chanos chanos TaxID=29144 RepID=A0A6J2VUM9_CHACN|nr:protein disulfide-isomerase-like [Chanos chanos]